MALTASTMLPLGTEARGFRLPDTDGELVAVEDFPGASASSNGNGATSRIIAKQQ